MPTAAAAVDICQSKGEKKRKEVDLAANIGSGPPKKRVRKRCSAEGCTNNIQNGGVCFRHGAKKKPCSVDDCTNQVVNGGVCIRHGAKVKLCSVDNCTNYAKKGGVCVQHGAKGDRCKLEGCTLKGDFSGFCITHLVPRPNQNYYNLQIQQQQLQQ